MAYIYKITNDVNGKNYIGKTELSIEQRFKQHCQDAFKDRCKDRPLYRAMRKYGLEHFHVSEVEQTDNPEEREVYWIEQYDSFKTGYNATKGGDGKSYLDYDLIVDTYRELKTQTGVAKKLGIDEKTVRKVLKEKQEPLSNLKPQLPINQYDLQGNYIATYPSARAAGIAIGKIDPAKNSNGAAASIIEVCRGKRNIAYGYKWVFSK